MQHPLKRRWTYWFLNDQRDWNWESRLKAVATFGTVEEFWGYTTIFSVHNIEYGGENW